MYAKLAFRNIKKSFKDYQIYFITLVFGVCVFYAFNSITQQNVVLQFNEAQGRMMELLNVLISGVSVLVIVILGFLVVYANRYLVRRRKKEFAIYLTLGMRRGQVSGVIVMETLLVGLVSLAVGMLLGYAVSQVLVFVTAALFDVKMDMFTLFFSPQAALKTVLYFALVYVVTLVLNVFTISKFKLIDLLNADRKNESVTLRSLPLSVVLFLASVAMLGVAYWLLIENGMVMLDEKFWASTALMVVGTLLFFYSLSGFLLRAVQSSKGVYLRGLNMFTLRQLNNKVNSAWLSISLVCITLFFALTATCTGFAITSTMNGSLEKATPFDATLSTYVGYVDPAVYLQDDSDQGATVNASGSALDLDAASQTQQAAAAVDYRMETTLRSDIPNWDSLVTSAQQLDQYQTDVLTGTIINATDYQITAAVSEGSVSDSPMLAMPLSQFNAVRALHGLEPVTLADDQYLIACDFDELKGLWNAFMQQNDTWTIFGKTVHPAQTTVDDTVIETSTLNMNTGVFVVPDSIIPSNAAIARTLLNLDLAVDGDTDGALKAALDDAYGKDLENTTGVWPVLMAMTRQEVFDQAIGLSTIVSYLAIYIGVVLLMACAAILSLQQLMEASDSANRYALLSRIGAERKQINHALYWQIGIYFVFPLILALAHTVVALSVVTNVVKLLGAMSIALPLAITVGIALVIYGGYFALTCISSKNAVPAS